MKLAVASLVALMALAGAQGAAMPGSDNASTDLASALAIFINSFQKVMPCGYPEMNLPVLAPYYLPYANLDASNEQMNITGSMTNLYVTGMNKFKILGGSYNATTGRFTYDMLYPEIQILAEENAHFNLKFLGYPLDFHFDGLLNWKFVDFRFIGEFSIKPQHHNNTLQMKIHQMNFLVGDIVSSSWNKNWDIAFNNFMNKWAADSLQMFDQAIQPAVKDLYEKYVLPIANEGLAQIDESELINAYLSVAAQFDAVNCQKSGSLYDN